MAKEFWIDITRAKRSDVALAFAYKRAKIAHELAQISIDLESYNENWNKEAPVVFVYDFTNDVREAKALGLLKRGAKP